MSSRRAAASVLAAVVAALACPAASGGTVTISGNVYDGNQGPLQKSNVYHVVGPVVVPLGTTLTIEEGTVVKFGANYGFAMDGVLIAQGTDSERIVFTSIHDDNHGGDSNQNGSASFPLPGDWKGLLMGDGSDGSLLEYCDLRFAGTATNSGAVELADTVIEIHHVLFADCSWTGLNLDDSNHDNDATVSDCEFLRCDRPIAGVKPDSLKRITGVVSTDCVSGDHFFMLGSTGDFSEDADLGPEHGINGVLVGGFGIPGGVKVTLRPGVVWKLGSVSAFRGISVSGELEVLGDATNPVVFTSFLDDSFGGDTNGDGNATTPVPGEWYGIGVGGFGPDERILTMEHAVVRYGGYNGAHLVDLSGRKSATLRDCVFEHGGRHGVYLHNTLDPIVIERCASDHNAGIAYFDAAVLTLPNLLDNTATGNGGGDYLRTRTTITITTPLTIGPRNYPGPVLVAGSGLDVGSNGSLTLAPGTVVKFEPGAGTVSTGSGALHLSGTADAPIVFTSLRDDAILGDTNKDGATTSPAPGDWGGVDVGPTAAASELDHLVIRYGGSGQAQVRCRSANGSVRSVRSEFAKGDGFFADSHKGAARNWIALGGLQDGIELGGGSFDVLNATSAGNTGFGFKRANGWTGQLRSSIAWSNTAGAFSNFTGSEVFHCDGGFAGSNGNVAVDPLFEDLASGDVRLQPTSPCIEAGDPADVPTGTDAAGLPRALDRDFDRAMRVDMGAYEAGHVTIAVSGDFTPGGTVTLTSDGTPGLSALMFIGFAETDVLFKPYGRLFIDLSQPWLLLPWPSSPAIVTDTLPASLSTPLLVLFQEVVMSARAGNASNLARMLVE